MKKSLQKAPKIRTYFYFLIFFIIFAVLIFKCPKTYAQQTIITVPSSEMLPAGNLILKESNGFDPFSNGYVTLSPNATIGIGRGMDITTGISTTLDGGTSVKGNIGTKKVWFLNNSTRLTLGGVVSPYLNEREHANTFIYSHFSQRIKKTKTSITAGAYLHGQNSFPDKFGALIGLEQVLIPNKLRLAIDWLSTTDSFGKMGIGLKYRPVSTVSITSAVIVPNQDIENIAFNLSISKALSFDSERLMKRRQTNVD